MAQLLFLTFIEAQWLMASHISHLQCLIPHENSLSLLSAYIKSTLSCAVFSIWAVYVHWLFLGNCRICLCHLQFFLEIKKMMYIGIVYFSVFTFPSNIMFSICVSELIPLPHFFTFFFQPFAFDGSFFQGTRLACTTCATLWYHTLIFPPRTVYSWNKCDRSLCCRVLATLMIMLVHHCTKSQIWCTKIVKKTGWSKWLYLCWALTGCCL